jgi:hypothetical protein
VREDQNGFAERVLRWALRLYSPDERAWGDAIKAESYLIVGFFPRLWWAMGGLITAFRSFRARSWNFSKRTRTSCNRSQKPVAPLGWKRALICVVVSASLLLAPGVRQGLRLVVNSWYGFVEPDISPWRTLAREADSRGDASTMACAAMRLPLEEAIPLAKRAVTKDHISNLDILFYSGPICSRSSEEPRSPPGIAYRFEQMGSRKRSSLSCDRRKCGKFRCVLGCPRV